jgi:hypothetical protein
MQIPAVDDLCQTPQQLRAWVEAHLQLRMPQKPVCPHHQSPLAYLWHAYHEPAGDAVVWAPRGGGKTSLGAAATLLDLLHKPGCQVRILGGSLEQSLRMWEHLEPMLQRLAPDAMNGRERARRITLATGSGAAVLTQSQRAVRGLRVQKLRCDEVELFKPDVWAAAQLATRSRSAEECERLAAKALEEQEVGRYAGGIRCAVEALSTLHQPFGLMQEILDSAQARGVPIFRWCLLDVLERCPAERECKSCGLREECGGRLRRAQGGFFSIEDAVAMKGRVSAATWEAEMLCLRPSTSLSVFPEFDPDRHIAEEPPWQREWSQLPPLAAYSIDFGYAAPFVCLLVQFDEKKRLFVADEHVRSHLTVEKQLIAIQAKGWPWPAFVACDGAGVASNDQTAHSNTQLCRSVWPQVRTEKAGINTGLDSIRADLSPALGEARLCIHPRCVNLIRSLRTYRYSRPHDEKPLKDGVADHAVDALRYFYANRSGGARSRVC